jgi:uncharacterized protein YndB with AHSA1/START domain
MGPVDESISRMTLESVRMTAVLPASADRVYAAWLDGAEHSRMTGGDAHVDARVGGEVGAWDGYIAGTIVDLEPGRRIVQTWRSTDFPLGHADSRLEVHLREAGQGCEITLIHTGIPEGQGAKYEEGWRTRYLTPMTKYFAKSGAKKAAPKKSPSARKKPAAKKAATAKRNVARKSAAKKTRRTARPLAGKKKKK